MIRVIDEQGNSRAHICGVDSAFQAKNSKRVLMNYQKKIKQMMKICLNII